MKIAVHGKNFSREICHLVQNMFYELNLRNFDLYISSSFIEIIKESGISLGEHKIYAPGDDLSQFDFMFSMGGDGTFLESLTHVGPHEIPIMGINTGRLGFLSTTPKEEYKKAIDQLENKKYVIEDRLLIHLDSDQNIFDKQNFALNEFAILKRDSSSMIVVHTFINGEYLNSYWADGLLVSTPTGSTGYNLSCGGPFMLPYSSNFIIAPISAHNLNVRPMVVPDDCVISFRVESRSKNFLASLDSRSETVDCDQHLSVRKETFNARMVKLEGYSFLDTLRQKLNWGLDVRN